MNLPHLNIVRGSMAALLAGAVSALAFAPLNIWIVLFVAFPVLILLLDQTSDWRHAAMLGWCFGFGQFLVGMHWIGLAFTAQDDTLGWAAVPAVILLASGLALFPAVTLATARRWLWRPGATRALVVAGAWWLAEMARGTLFTGFPWNPLGSAWSGSDAVTQSAALLGAPGLALLTALAACSLVTFQDWKPNRWKAVTVPCLFGAILIGMAGFGNWRLTDASQPTAGGVNLVLVQANISQADKWLPSRRCQNLETYLRLSEEALERQGAGRQTLVIWPETAVPYLPANNPGMRRLLGSILPEKSVVLTGAPHMEAVDGDRQSHNSLFAIDQDGEILARYDKNHLVPFGEYLPFRGVLGALGLNQLVSGSSDFNAGIQRQPIDLGAVPAFSPLICYEVIFPGEVIPEGPRPRWLLNITNDAWFGKSWGPYQHLALARFRAVEEGMPLVRAAGTGISAVVDSYGRVVASLPLGEQAVLVSSLPGAIDPPPFARFGTLPAWGLFIGLMVYAFLRKTNGKVPVNSELP